MKDKLSEMFFRVKDAYVEQNGYADETALGAGQMAEGRYWVMYKPRHDSAHEEMPKTGRIVILMLNDAGDAIDSHPFRSLMITDAEAMFAGAEETGISILYTSGEEENIATNLFEFLIENKDVDDLTYDEE